MPTPTYDLIASNVLSSSASSVTFSSIPATYRDLIVVAEATSNTATINLTIRFNGDTSNTSSVAMYGDGSSAGSYTQTSISLAEGSGTTTTALMGMGFIMDYSATDKHKTVLSRGGIATGFVGAFASRWASTSAINEITVRTTTVNQFASGSTFYLYGIVS